MSDDSESKRKIGGIKKNRSLFSIKKYQKYINKTNLVTKASAVSLVVSLLILVFSVWGTVIRAFYDNTSVFDVVAEVEQINVKTYTSPKANWYFDKVDITYPCTDLGSENCAENEDGEKFYTKKNYSGSLKLANNIEIMFLRIGLSSFMIELMPLNIYSDGIQGQADKGSNLIGELLTDDDEYEDTVSGTAIIIIENIEERIKQGGSLFYNFSGDVQLANSKDYPDSHLKPVLTSGDVSILETSFILNENYIIGPYQLDLGDAIDMVGKKGNAEGFVKVDGSPGIKTVFSVEAEMAIISRYKFDGYEVSASSWNRLFHDRTLGYLWVTFAFVFSLFLVTFENIIEGKD